MKVKLTVVNVVFNRATLHQTQAHSTNHCKQDDKIETFLYIYIWNDKFIIDM